MAAALRLFFRLSDSRRSVSITRRGRPVAVELGRCLAPLGLFHLGLGHRFMREPALLVLFARGGLKGEAFRRTARSTSLVAFATLAALALPVALVPGLAAAVFLSVGVGAHLLHFSLHASEHALRLLGLLLLQHLGSAFRPIFGAVWGHRKLAI